MLTKYNRSLSGLPDNNSSLDYERRLADKSNSIYASINTQRIAESKKHHSTLYDGDASRYHFKHEHQIKRALNQDKVKRSLNVQEHESNKENIFSAKTKLTLFKQPSKYEEKKVLNQNLISIYSDEILDYIRTQEKSTTPNQFLKSHTIPQNLRAKMVDWMIEVLASYKCTEQTFFLAVRILDLFLDKTEKNHEVGDLHLTGVTAMFIACKYEEIYPMKLQVVHEKIAHRKLTADQIKRKESDILQTIGFNLVGGTIYEIFNHLLMKIELNLEPKIFTYMKKICVYLAKMILYEYDLVSQNDYTLLSGALIFVAFKIIEQLQPNFKSEQKIKEVIEVAQLTNDRLIETASKVLSLAKSFDKHYPNLENLKKFNGFQMEDIEEKASA